MKNRSLKVIVSLVILMIFSCDEPETVVTNIVHADGSITRKIEMRTLKNNFELRNLQVPFDSAWKITDNVEINEKGDTTWIRTAEKLFAGVDEINITYGYDSFANINITRHATFKKKFRWFNTEFRFSEDIERKLPYGHPVDDFLSKEEKLFFYSPQSLQDDKKNGPDSLIIRDLEDSVNLKIERWIEKTLVSGWIDKFSELVKGENGIANNLLTRENELQRLIEQNTEKFDSLWDNGIILKEILSEENAIKFRSEADSAMSVVTDDFFIDFREYSVRIAMPGRLTGTNGFIDSSKVLLWPVRSDFFMTQSYEMWAESKVPNIWAWIISALFILFVIAGFGMRIIKKG